MTDEDKQRRRLDVDKAYNECRVRAAERFASYTDDDLKDFCLILAKGEQAAYAPQFSDVRALLESLACTALLGELQRRQDVRDLEED